MRVDNTTGMTSAQSLPGPTSGSRAKKRKCFEGGLTLGKTFYSASSLVSSAFLTLGLIRGAHGGS